MSLYQKVRPQELGDIVGNTAVVAAARKMLASKERPHAILISGPTGSGKTTLGRILAKEFGTCSTSIFEINAANMRGIDTIREIISTSSLATIDGGSKTYIFDESHQFSKDAQNALLKLIEDDYKGNNYYIFCTTDPKGLIPTIRSRCTLYEMSKLPEKQVLSLLDKICVQEGLNVSPDIRAAVALTCDGSARAALVSLEAVNGIDDLDTALGLLQKGTESDVEIIDLCKHMYSAPQVRMQKWKLIIQQFDALDSDPENIRRAILGYLYKKLVTAEKQEEALDLTHLINIFSTSTFYGGKSMLGGLVARACFEKNPY